VEVEPVEKVDSVCKNRWASLITLGGFMQQITDERKKEIIKALEDRGAKLPCPRCSNPSFTLLDGYFNQTIQTNLRGIVLGGPSVPTVVVACTRCGYLSQHALGALGLLPKEEAKNE
jgi:hypothetical protein